LRAELAPTPGRLDATLRIVVAAAIVLVTSITLQVPWIALSLFIVVLFGSSTSVFSAIEAIFAVLVVALATALTILVLRFTIDHSLLRFVAMAVAIFLAMYFSRTSEMGTVGVPIGIVVILALSHADLVSQPEAIVRYVLWIWVAVAYPAALIAGLNFLLLPADPEPMLRREMSVRLRAVARAARAAPRSEGAHSAARALAAYATVGSGPLLKLLRLAEIRRLAVRTLHTERTARILVLERLVQSAALLSDLAVEPSPGERVRLESIAVACDMLASSIVERSPPQAPAPFGVRPNDASPSALASVLSTLERLVDDFTVAERPPADQPVSRKRPLVSASVINLHYAQFALKATLAAMFCYVAFTGVDWSGIFVCMPTCVIVALGSTGATIHKATLRLVGSAIGAAAALASIVFLLPHMTSIVPLTLLVAGIMLPAAWIATGSQRTAYIGMQIVFAFSLAVLTGYEPTTNLDEVRDRIVGVFFGVIVTTFVFSYIWPERVATGMRHSLAEALRRMAQIGIGLPAARADARALRASAWHALAEAGQRWSLYAFEPAARSPAGAETRVRMQRRIELTQRVLLVQAALIEARQTVDSATMEPVAGDAGARLDRAVADALEGIATAVEDGTRTEPVDLRTPLGALQSEPPVTRQAAGRLDGEVPLCELLVDRVETLQRAAERA
jgi:multidrug resistance protein MdtO